MAFAAAVILTVLATAAFEPEQIKPTQVEPKDFDAYWDAGKAELAAVPMDARRTLLPIPALQASMSTR